MNTTPSPEANSSKISNIYILPCLQEIKYNPISPEKEQIPADPNYLNNDNGFEPKELQRTKGTSSASDEFDKIWWKKDANPELKGKYYNHGIIIPYMDINEEYKKNGIMSFVNLNQTVSECRHINIEDKWKMYIEFLNNIFSKSDNTTTNAAFIISHHNRMKETDNMFGLIPFNKGFEKYSYANNFCLKITMRDENVMFDVANEGFPDKDKYIYFPETKSSEYTKTEMNDYCKKYINLEPIEAAAKKYNQTKPLIIYLIRHGNALHNQPVGKKQIDSSLTPLGMYQAVKLSEKIKADLSAEGLINIDNLTINNINPLLCCSFLQRTQLTGLILLKQLGMLDQNMDNLHKKMINIAYNRWSKADGIITRFNNFSPINESSGYNGMISYLEAKDKNEQIIKKFTRALQGTERDTVRIEGSSGGNTRGGKKSKKNQPKRARRKSRKHRKNKK